MWFMVMEETSKFSVSQTAQSLTCSIMEKPNTGLDDCLRMLLPCFRKRMSGLHSAPNTTSLLKRWRSCSATSAKSLSVDAESCRNGEATVSSVDAAVTADNEPSQSRRSPLLVAKWFRIVPYNL